MKELQSFERSVTIYHSVWCSCPRIFQFASTPLSENETSLH